MSGTGSAVKRTRIVLSVAIVLLAIVLGVLVVMFVRLLTPVVNVPEAQATEMEWVRSLYGFGPALDQQMQSPSSVAVAPNGDIYVTDPVRARVMVFRPDGTFRRLLHTGAGGTKKGQFVRPESIDIDENGDVYIADSWAGKVIVFDAAGAFSREWPVERQARGVYVDGDRVYVLDQGSVLLFEKDGTPVGDFGSRGTGHGQIDGYQGITARDGTVYIADSYNKRLQSFSESGTVKWVLPDGVPDRSGPQRTVTREGDGSGGKALPQHRWDLPQDLVFDGRGRLVVVDAFNFELAVVDPETGLVQQSYGEFGHMDGQFFYPTSIDYDPVRDWFVVADTQNNRVQIVRLPDSSPISAAVAWRALASPYRYLVIPVLMVLGALAFGVVAARRIARVYSAEKSELALTNDE